MRSLFIISIFIVLIASACEIMPRNTLKDCQVQCQTSRKSKACYTFCDCIHKKGQPLNTCLEEYDNTPLDSVQKP